jgi:hypothetical protein
MVPDKQIETRLERKQERVRRRRKKRSSSSCQISQAIKT